MTYVIIGECIDYKNWSHLEFNGRDCVEVTSEPVNEWKYQQCSNLKRSTTDWSTPLILISLLTLTLI